MEGSQPAAELPDKTGFAFEFWAPGYVIVVALLLHLEMSADIWRLGPGRLAMAGGMCWAWWGAVIFSGWGRIERRAVGWLVGVCAVVAGGAVLWPEHVLAVTVQSLLFLWAGRVYVRLLGRWSAVVAGLPVAAAGLLYSLSDILGKGGALVVVFTGPLAPLFDAGALATAAVLLYAAPSAFVVLAPAAKAALGRLSAYGGR